MDGAGEVGLLHELACLGQVDHAKSLHYIGTGVAFPAGLLFVCLHCVLFYHGATTPLDMAMAYLRSVLAVIAFITLVLSILLGQGSQELIPWLNSSPPPGWGRSGTLSPVTTVLHLIYLFGMAIQVLRGAHILLSLSLALFQVESSFSTRVLSYSMELLCVNGCSSSISSFSTAPSAMSSGQSPQTHWWLHYSQPPAGPVSPLGAAAPLPTSTVLLRVLP